MNYKAFISYSHAADGRLAPAVQSALHRFAKPWYRLRAIRVFRDKTTLAATPALWPSIEKALGESEFFLLLASPEAASSPWVQREIAFWIERRPEDRDNFLIILTDGNLAWDNRSGDFDWATSDALPRIAGKPFVEEPMFLDLRWARKEEHLSLRHPEFRDAIATLAATLHNLPKDQISGEEVRQYRIARRLAWCGVIALIALCVLAVVLGYVANQRRIEAERQQRIAVARQLAAQGALAGAQQADLLHQSVLLGLESVARLPSLETEQGLRERISLLPQPFLQLRAKGIISNLVISPDGEQVAAAAGSAAYVWDTATGREIAQLQHDGVVEMVAFRPGGRQMATGSWDQTARIWNLPDGAEIAQLKHEGQVDKIAFSPDGVYFATTISIGLSSVSNAAWLWDADNGRSLGHVSHDDKASCKFLRCRVTAISFAPDSKRFATASTDSTVRLWDTVTRRELGRLAHNSMVLSVAFNHSGTALVTGSEDGRVRQWEVRSGKELGGLDMRHTGAVDAVSFSPDDRFLATGSADHTARVWDAKTGREVCRMAHGAGIRKLSFSPDGKEIATVGDGQAARLWDATTGQETARAVHESSVNAVAFSPNGRFLASASGHVRLKGEARALVDPVVSLWDLDVGRTINQTIHQGSIAQIEFSRDGRYLATASWDRTAKVWDPVTGKERLRILHDDRVLAVALSGDGQWVATGSIDGVAHLRHVADGRETTLPRAAGGVGTMAFSQDSRHLAIGTMDGTVRVWDIANGAELFQRHTGVLVSKVSYSADGRYLLIVMDKLVSLWSAADGREVRTLAHAELVGQAGWSPDGQYVATKTTSGVYVWKPDDGAKLALLKHDDVVKGFSWHPDGRRIATWDNESIRLRDARDGRPIGNYTERSPFRAEFTPDGQHIVIIGDDRTVRVRELTSGRETARLLHSSDPYNVTVSPNGRYIATISGENVVTVWMWRMADAIDQACSRLTRNLTFDEWQRYLNDEPYRKTCSALPVHFSVIEAALELARSGDHRGFTAIVQRLEILEPGLPWSRVKAEGTRMAAIGRGERAARRGEELIRAGKANEGLTLLKESQTSLAEAQKIGDTDEIGVELWSRVGWLGTIWGESGDFLYASDQAVARDPSWPAARDTRGVARALSGQLAGALEDFEAFVKTAEAGELKSRRLRWIDALKKGQNPFTREELQALRQEG
jgi:WD40 repeat protein